MSGQYSRYPVLGGGGASGVSSLNGQTGSLTLFPGSNITIVPVAGGLEISATSSSSGTVTSFSFLPTSVGTVINPTTNPQLTLNQSGISTNGYLSATDWNTFNNKQPAGSYLTALIGDVTTLGSVATLANLPERRYIDFGYGNDANTGTITQPWKTLTHAYATVTDASINKPYVFYLSGGNNDIDTVINANPNVNLFCEYPIQINGNFTLAPGFEALTSFTNIVFTGNFSFIDSTTHASYIDFYECEFFQNCTCEMTGSGTLGITAINTVFISSNWTLPGAFGLFEGCNFLGSTVFNDSGNDSYYEFIGGYTDSAFTITGGIDPAYFSGFVWDIVFGASLTFVTTGSGVPNVQFDSSGLPPTYTGTANLTYLSFSQHESYTPAIPANWVTPPTQVKQALDELAATPGSVVSANGFAGTVAPSTHAITLSTNLNTPVIAGNGTSLIAATTTGTGSTVVLSASPTLTGNPVSTNLTINGIGGNGYINYNSQSATPAAPTSGFTVFADATNRFTQINTNGFTTTYDSSGITANRVYVLRDVSGKFVLDSRWSAASQTVSTTPFTILSTDAFASYFVVTSTLAITINLPTAISVADRIYLFTDISGNANVNNITLVPSGTDKIEGLNSNYIINQNYGSIILLSDGVGSWWIIGGSTEATSAGGVNSFSTNGSITAPAGVTMATVYLRPGSGGGGAGSGGGGGFTGSTGGGGSGSSGGGGGGSALFTFIQLTVVPGTTYNIIIGAGGGGFLGGAGGAAGAAGSNGTSGGNGGQTSFIGSSVSFIAAQSTGVGGTGGIHGTLGAAGTAAAGGAAKAGGIAGGDYYGLFAAQNGPGNGGASVIGGSITGGNGGAGAAGIASVDAIFGKGSNPGGTGGSAGIGTGITNGGGSGGGGGGSGAWGGNGYYNSGISQAGAGGNGGSGGAANATTATVGGNGFAGVAGTNGGGGGGGGGGGAGGSGGTTGGAGGTGGNGGAGSNGFAIVIWG
jgi:hypothetical protein